jgi:DNA-directed RNA polymerase beta' subunit
MANADNEVLLHKYVETQVETISPFKLRSNALKLEADSLVVNNNEGLEQAKKLRKEIIAHENTVEAARKAITSQFDSVTKSLITLQREVLYPVVEARAVVGDKVLSYEAELERIRQIEVDRVNKIITLLVDHVDVARIRSLKELSSYEELFEARVKALKETDAKIPEIISLIGDVRYNISEQRDHIRRLEAQSNEAKRNELERQAQQAKAQKDAAAAARTVASAPKTGSRMRMTFEIINPDAIPRELCVPSEALIRNYINEHNLESLDGVLIKRERVL